MKCASCNQEVNSEMKAALRANSCPFCGSYVMDPKRAQQYNILTKKLDQTRFTNKNEVDAKIRDKVISTLLDNFEFIPLEKTNETDDVVILDDNNPSSGDKVSSRKSSSSEVDLSDAAPRSLSSAAVRDNSKKNVSSGASNIYQQAQEDMYSSGSLDESSSYQEDVDEEDVRKYFQNSVPPDMQERVQRSLSKVPKQSPASGRGIKRLKK